MNRETLDRIMSSRDASVLKKKLPKKLEVAKQSLENLLEHKRALTRGLFDIDKMSALNSEIVDIIAKLGAIDKQATYVIELKPRQALKHA